MYLRNVLVILFALLSPLAFSKTYDITEFGATANSGLESTKAIQSAIDACSNKGGGTVLVPTGEFITGSLLLRDSVHLHLETGAELKGSANLQEYTRNGFRYGLIYAFGAKNISITGTGEINGNGSIFFDPEKPHVGADFDRQYTRQGEDYMTFDNGIQDGPIAYDDRPGMLVVLLRCENVLIENVTFRDSPSWTFRIGDCDGVHVRGISILNNLLVPNSDGIHCTTSRNVRISDCDIRAGDDAIIVTGFGDEITPWLDESRQRDYTRRKRGNKTGYAENIVVTNCTLQSRSSGIRVGYGDNNMRNCTFSNLVIYDSNRGIGLFARDAGSISNMLFSNITIHTRLHTGHWWGNGEPIHISSIAQNADVPVGTIEKIQFQNIVAQSGAGVIIWGDEPGLVKDISLEQINLSVNAGPHTKSYGGNFDLRPVADLQDAIFEHDIPALFAKNIDGLFIDGFDYSQEKGLPAYYNDQIVLENIKNDVLEHLRGASVVR